MATRSCRSCRDQVLVLPCEDLGGRQLPFEAVAVPVESLPNLRYAWAYVRGRGMVNLDGQRQVPAKVMLRHSCDATAVRDFVAANQACVAEGASAGRESPGRGDGYRPGMFAVLRNQPRPWSPACRDLGAVV